MKTCTAVMAVLMLVLTQAPAYADDGEDRSDERGRSDERQAKQDCREEGGAVGKDKRDCKQEEARDGVRGEQGEDVDDTEGTDD
jgi:hypothetical protein